MLDKLKEIEKSALVALQSVKDQRTGSLACDVFRTQFPRHAGLFRAGRAFQRRTSGWDKLPTRSRWRWKPPLRADRGCQRAMLQNR